jgi:hypothetical protein
LATRNWLFFHENSTNYTSFFTREFLTKNDMALVYHSPQFSMVSQMKIKFKGRHFDTVEVIEAESQAVLNTHTEHNFRNAFEVAEALEAVHTRRSALLRS